MELELAEDPEGDFNPRSPRGERPNTAQGQTTSRKFQPSLPARGATRGGDSVADSHSISTLAPREGSDVADRLTGGDVSISTLAPREGSDNAEVWHAWR